MAYTTIDDPSAHFHTQLFSGTGSSQSITNDANAGDLQPDWVWIKKRAGGTARNSILTDSTRGVTKCLSSALDDAEFTNTNGLTAFGTDGFTVGSYDSVNESSGTYVAWQWKANGGTTTTNDASSTGVGGLDSVYQANTTAGFSIVTYTGSGSNTTVAHGLGNIPEVIIFKKRTDDAEDWLLYHHTQGNAAAGKLNTTAAFETGSASLFDSTTPTSTVFSIKTNSKVNDSTDTYIAYCFSEVQGYSKFGSYTGNNNADGPFVYTGFKPAWLLIKNTGGTGNWRLYDNKRSPHNLTKETVLTNDSNAETNDNNEIDFLSNGFKCRATDSNTNGSSTSHIYMAFAEHPFVSSKGVPATAR